MATPAPGTRVPIAILTDFGYRDHYAGVMKGVIASISPQAPIIDLTHGIPPQQVLAGALALRESVNFFPRRTIFLGVVDPGVGTDRKPIAVETKSGLRLVGPDNGLLWLAAERAEIKRIVELRSLRYRLPKVSASFHGRDIFAPAAAWLWRGVPMGEFGPPLQTIMQLDADGRMVENQHELCGEVIYIDGFGNLITNISRTAFERFARRFQQCRLSIRIKRRASLALYKAYAEAPRGVPLAIFGSFDLLEIAVRDGNAARHFNATLGVPVLIRTADSWTASR
ncbi:MAG: SAM-dependent chlorinase/fluorinase [Deltaproteobacteria bacterium]|nr:SAM-dependent chlorinase/fluorinase [Deltaproteobacteria bacterium]